MINKKIAVTPHPPYYAVIFTSTKTDVDSGYGIQPLKSALLKLNEIIILHRYSPEQLATPKQ